MTPGPIGEPISRVDGPQKVTGRATYAAEFDVRGQAHGAIVRSTIAKGRVASIDTAVAERAPGVLAVLTHRNAPKLPYRPHKGVPDAEVGERLHVLQDDSVNHQGQPIALVIAETLEQATHAAMLVRVTYAPERAITDVTQVTPKLLTQEKTDQRPPETRRGDPDGALSAADVKIDERYVMPREYHNPIETHATIAAWEGDRLTLWDKTQWVHNTADEIAAVFGIPPQNVRVISPFVGGAFGSGLRTWPHVTLAALGARVVGRPVKVMLSRSPSLYGPARRAWSVTRWPPRRHRARRLPGDLHVRGVLRGPAGDEPLPVLVPERLHAAPRGRDERAHTDLHARPWRGERQLRARVRDGRTGGRARYGSRPTPVAQRTREGRAHESAVLQPLDSRMLQGRGRALRVEPPQPQARLDAGREVANRLGHGDSQLSNELRTCVGSRAPASGRLGRGDERGQRHGARDVDLDDAGRR